MTARVVSKRFLKVGEMTCSVSLYAAASTSEGVSFHTLNSETGHRVRRQFVDSEIGKPVERDDQAKGYEIAPGIRHSGVRGNRPEVSDIDKTLKISTLLACADIDDVYLDKRYYLMPSDRSGEEALGLIREGMRSKNVAALARTVLFRRCRTLLVRADEHAPIATALNFDYEVRALGEFFDAGLASFIKTSGGTGLHVVAPLKPKFSSSMIKTFTKTLANQMRSDSPDRYVATITKAKRRYKVLIDFLRNRRGATTFARHSSRGRLGAPVSMPLPWDELSTTVGPDHLTVINATARLQALGSDPWEDFWSSAAVIR